MARVRGEPPDGLLHRQLRKGGRDGTGVYERKHAPAISFTSIRTDPRRCAYLQDFTAFRPGRRGLRLDRSEPVPQRARLPAGIGPTPGSPSSCPTILDSRRVPRRRASRRDVRRGRRRRALGRAHRHDRGLTACSRPGFRSTERHDHYTLLRTIQEAWGLDCLAESCAAGTMDEFFSPRELRRVRTLDRPCVARSDRRLGRRSTHGPRPLDRRAGRISRTSGRGRRCCASRRTAARLVQSRRPGHGPRGAAAHGLRGVGRAPRASCPLTRTPIERWLLFE